MGKLKTHMNNFFFIASLVCCVLIGLSTACEVKQDKLQNAEKSITEEDLEKHVRALASDAFEGRKPFTEGEKKTIAYIREAFERMGLPGGYRGEYFQDVPLVEVTIKPSEDIRIDTEEGPLHFRYPDEVIASTQRIAEKIEIKDSELVFAGYGIVAPEYGWNDYEGLDAEGKTVVVMVNDPGFASQDSRLFKGNAMTYYGRWTYKYEEAARQGALGVMVVHETGAAGYPWSVLQNSAGSELYLQAEDHYMSRCALQGWITLEAAKTLFAKAGKDFDSLAASASRPGFASVPLGATISLTMENTLKRNVSRNVLALCPGSDRADECIVYTAHWDHLGIGPEIRGDSIYNGCADNACAVAWLLEIAEAFSQLQERPSRSVLFIAPTAEESGLLGSAYYAAHPVFPMAKTVAVMNTDILPLNGPMKDVTITGYGQSELDDYVETAARKQERYVMPDPEAHNGMYYRSDHFSFARLGVPALFAKGCNDHAEHGKAWARQKMKEYWENHYHRPSDEFDPESADLRGLLLDTKLFFNIGLQLSMEETFPAWKEGSEFKAVREKNIKRDVGGKFSP